MSCTGCSKRNICEKICPYIEGLLYSQTHNICKYNVNGCYYDIGTECVAGNPDNLYQNYDGEYGTCNETRCSKFSGCAFGHKCWVPGCNADSCENYDPIEKGQVFKFGVESGFRKEIAYDPGALEIVKHRLTNYFDLDRDEDLVESPVGNIEDIVYVTGLDCKTCKIKSKCIALSLCKKMATILTTAITDSVEGEFENMQIKILSAYRCSGDGCVFFSPKKVDACPRCGSMKFTHTNITSQAVNRYIKWGLSNIRKKFLIDLDMFDTPEYDKECVVCGKPFKTKYKHQQFCIEECRVKLYTKKRRDVRRKRRAAARKNRLKCVAKQRKCANPDCQILFTPKPFQIYHSKSCRLRVTRMNYVIHIPDLGDVSEKITRR